MRGVRLYGICGFDCRNGSALRQLAGRRHSARKTPPRRPRFAGNLDSFPVMVLETVVYGQRDRSSIVFAGLDASGCACIRRRHGAL